MKKIKYSSPKIIELGKMMQITKGHKSHCTDKNNTATKHANSNCTG